MKTKNALFAVAILVGLTACKNEEQERAERTVDGYAMYVDSLGNVGEAEAMENWEQIEAGYEQRMSELEAAMANLSDREAAEARVNEARAKYEALREKYQAKIEAENAASNTGGGTALGTSLFGNEMGSDMTFAWVNKDNILSVYERFYNEFDKNKNNYSREDLDEIKTYYEALDNRKNTVEKEGLSSEHNRKIADLKVKFAPAFKWERLTSKGEENRDAKEKGR